MHFQQLPRKWKVEFKTSSLTFASHKLGTQARNQLGTPRGRRVFWEGPKFFTLCPIYFSKVGEKFSRGALPPCVPLVTGLWEPLCVFFCTEYDLWNSDHTAAQSAFQGLEPHEPTWNWLACMSWKLTSLNWNSRGENSPTQIENPASV